MGRRAVSDSEKFKPECGSALRRTEAERGITASEVRTCIEKGENWQQLVPRTVYEYVLSHGIDQRIREYKERICNGRRTLK